MFRRLCSTALSHRRYVRTYISKDVIESFHRDGYSVIPSALSKDTIAAIRADMDTLLRDFDPKTISIFSTKEQTRTSDDYFLGSGDKIRCATVTVFLWLLPRAFHASHYVWISDSSLKRARSVRMAVSRSRSRSLSTRSSCRNYFVSFVDALLLYVYAGGTRTA